MREEQREGFRARRPDLDEMDVLPVGLGGAVHNRVERGFSLAPAGSGESAFGEFLRGSGQPKPDPGSMITLGERLRGPGDQGIERGVADVDGERHDHPPASPNS